MAKLFLDANIILDLIDSDRKAVELTHQFISDGIIRGDDYCTSCDIFTTVYYVASKKLSSLQVIAELEKILAFVEVIAIDIEVLKEAMNIVRDKDDFEDVLQYVCAKKGECSAIVTNDKGFYRGEIELISLK
ncbi:PIN domain-containing protein [Sulfuricurvum sp.]|uniref:type II toxin-antitoxin system VapC family toxin n=1 Tax=Sulfuricurvum sp. TaxID=2025608 RepID=UPI002634B046|nr:PIN domain-containing protein [Sulfuricurvum sp.]MDD2781084.1 PIN domain-containing protein [Sulfuricurvum sp.]